MIRSFGDWNTQRLYYSESVPAFQGFSRQAITRLNYLNDAISLQALRVPNSNRLEALSGDRAGQYSIRINRQWRICFRWYNGDAYDVEITDYH